MKGSLAIVVRSIHLAKAFGMEEHLADLNVAVPSCKVRGRLASGARCIPLPEEHIVEEHLAGLNVAFP